MTSLVLACFLIILNSCTSIEEKDSARFLSLESVLKLMPEKSDQDSVQSSFGRPDIVMQIDDSKDVAWIFKDLKTGYQRLALVFNDQKKLQSAVWMVSADEPEVNLENSQKRFPSAKFVAQDAPWENPHAAPDERFYVDREKGISITYRKTRKEVESISWFNPNSKQSSDRKPAVKYEL